MNEKEKAQGFCLKTKKAAVIGCGGLGCNIAVHLAGAGIGVLKLCDFDTVCRSNLNRQFLYTEEDIGQSKVKKAAQRLSLYSPDTEIFPIEAKIQKPEDLSFAKNCNIIVLAVDNAEARIVAQRFAEKENIPLVCGGINGFYGIGYLYIPGSSPCPHCAGLNENTSTDSNISAVAGIIGSLQSALTIRYLLTEDKNLGGKLHIYDSDSFSTLKIQAERTCSCKKYK